MSTAFYQELDAALTDIEKDGLYKRERLITSKQAADIVVNEDGKAAKLSIFVPIII